MMDLIEKSKGVQPDELDSMEAEYPVGSVWISKTTRRRATITYSGIAMVQLSFNENDPLAKRSYSHDDLHKLYQRM
jgi:hypothetical protein